MMNPYGNYEDLKASLEMGRQHGRYQRTLRLAVVIMCQEAARSYYLRLRAESVAAAKEAGHDE